MLRNHLHLSNCVCFVTYLIGIERLNGTVRTAETWRLRFAEHEHVNQANQQRWSTVGGLIYIGIAFTRRCIKMQRICEVYWSGTEYDPFVNNQNAQVDKNATHKQ